MDAGGRGCAACLVPVLALALLAPPEVLHAQQAPGQDGPDQDPVTAGGGSACSGEPLEPETKRQMDGIMDAVDQLMWQNSQLRESPADGGAARDAIERNNEAILRLMEQLDVLSPPIRVAEVPEPDRVKMDAAMLRLAMSGLPLLQMGVDPPTGSLGITVDVDRAGPDTEKRIREITADIDLTIKYCPDNASFRGPAAGTQLGSPPAAGRAPL